MTDPDQHDLQHLVEEVVDETGVTGVAVGVLDHARHLRAAAGLANAETDRVPEPSTLFPVGSISKTFASATLLCLVGDGLVALDDPASRHLPELADALPELCLEDTTVEHLASHTSGFDGDHLIARRAGGDLASLAGARRFFAPGEGWSYSNAGFTLIGAIVEAVTQRAFHRVVRDRILGPLGIHGAAYRADDVVFADVAAPHWVHEGTSYVIRRAGWQPGWELEPLDHAPGGLIASVDHLTRWAQFQLDGRGDDGAVILSAEQLARLHTPVVEAHRGVGIGLDWFVTDLDGTTTIGHGGSTAGYQSDVTVVPEAALGVTVLTNSTNGGVAVRAIRRAVLERFAGLVERDPVVDPGVTPPIEQLVGRYLYAFGILTVTAGSEAGTIVISTGPRDDVVWQPPPDPDVTCGFVDAHTIVGLSGPTRPIGTVGPVEDGRVAWLNWHERLCPRID